MNEQTRKVLICLDTSAHSYKVADQGIMFARKLNAQVSILHVVNVRGAADERARMSIEKKKIKARKFVAKILYTFACAALLHIEEGDPADVIIEKAAALQADVIVLGNRERKRASQKSVMSEVARRSNASILTV